MKRIYDLNTRFWNKIIKGKKASDCWSWNASHAHFGYGSIKNGRNIEHTVFLGKFISEKYLKGNWSYIDVIILHVQTLNTYI